MRKLLIDTDTASDDAVALVMALQNPEVEVEAITVVAGNVGLEQCVQNALYTVELCGKNVPVHSGLAKPIMRSLEDAREVHGEDGMGDIGLPLKGRECEKAHAVDVLIETICGSPGEITLVTLGPLSNVAAALLREPALAEAVESCVIMGGAPQMPGNVTPVAEFNIYADPEAAHVVFSSGIKPIMVGWDVCMASGFISPAEMDNIRAIGTDLSDFAMDIQGTVIEFISSKMKMEGFDLPDPLAMAVAIDPSISKNLECFVEVAYGDGLARGQTMVDYVGITGKEPNAYISQDVSEEGFQQMLKSALAS